MNQTLDEAKPFIAQTAVESAIKPALQKEEIVEWSGKPDPKTHMINALPILLCGIPWTGFSLFRLFIVDEFKIPDFSATYDYFPLFGVPFLFIGIAMLLSPFWYFIQARQLTYVITNKRVFSLLKGKIMEYPIADIGNIEKVENLSPTDPNCGDLFFSNDRDIAIHRNANELTPKKIGFKGISNLSEAAIALEKLKH